MSWKLIAQSEPIAGQEIAIDRDMVIGRHQQADIVLQAAHISRRHAALLLKDQALWIQDLNSSNGTFVNNQRVTEHLLQHDDEIQFENIRFQVIQAQPVILETAPIEPVVEESTVTEKMISDPAPTLIDPSVSDDAPINPAKENESVAPKTEKQPEQVAEPVQTITDQGMPTLEQRDKDVQLNRDGMPTQVGIPKPAPIPEHVEIDIPPEPNVVPISEPETRVHQVEQEQKNAKVGVVSFIVIAILIVLAVLFFMGQ